MRIDSPLMTNAQATGSFSGSFTGTFDGDIQADSVAYANVNNKPSLVSGSIQIDHDSATNFVANEHIDHSTITIGSGQGLTGGGTIVTSRSLTLDTGSAHFINAVQGISPSLPSGVVSGSAQIDYAAIQNQPTTISGAQASAIITNSAKTGISSQQASDITANNAKVGITTSQTSAITTNSNKTGISSQQASDITANNAKTGITSGQANAIIDNTAKTGITSGQASAITANTAKISYNSAASTKLGTIEENAQVNTVDSVAGKTGTVTLVKGDVGLGNVTNESKATMFTSPTFTGTPITDTLRVNSGGTIRMYNAAGNGFAETNFNESENKIQLNRGLVPSADGYWNIGTSSKRVGTVFAQTFTGALASTTTATTQADNDNSTKIATTAYVQREVSDLIGGAGAAFDTLLEISSSIANGDSDVVALTTTVGTKLAKASNLSDLTNAGTARTNLGLGSAAVSNTGDFLASSVTTISGAQASAITANTNKTGITSGQASAITANTAKVGYTDALVKAKLDAEAVISGSSQVSYNSITDKPTTITSGQASAITANTAKISYNSTASDKLGSIEENADVTDAVNVTAAGALMESEVENLSAVKSFDPSDYLVSSTTTISGAQASAITTNSAKVGITSSQASAITTNSAKVGITSSQASAITTNTADIGTNTTNISSNTGDIETVNVDLGANTTQIGINTGNIATNTAKVGITAAQANNITTNNSKVGITSSQASAITANSAKTGITSSQASAITANSAKISYDSTASDKLGSIEENAEVNVVDSVAGKTGAVSLVKGDVGLGNVTNESKATMFASPTFTGTVTAPTAADNDNSTKVATTAYVQREVADLIGGAGEAFNTLLEISSSIASGDSEVVSLTSTVATKLAKASNLSDLANAGTARTNLGLGSAAVANTGDFLASSVTTISSAQASAISTNSAKVGITTTQAGHITANNAKVGITTTQAGHITANNAKVGITSSQASAITANSAKVGITSSQASAITANTNKTGITSGQASAITANSAKTGITSGQASAITANTAKISYNSAASTKLGTIEESADVTDTVNVTAAGALMESEVENLAEVKAFDSSDYLVSSTTTITGAQATAISTNSNKVGITTTQAGHITANNAKISYNSAASTKLGTIAEGAEVNTVDSVAGKTGTVSLVKADVGLGNVTNQSKATMFASPAFTGTVIAPTPADNDNSTKVATTAFVIREISDIIGGAPAAFDTLSEISSSIANGDSDVVALTTVVGTKLAKSSNLSDLTNVSTARTNLGLGSAATTAASAYATSAQGTKADTAHGWGDHGAEGYTTYTSNQATNSNSAVNFSSVTATGDIVAYSSSDRRLKDNIQPIPDALQKIEEIGGYEFDWNDNQDTFEGHDIGVIAQEIEAVAPELVATRENGYKAVKYDKLTAILIQAVKELSAKVKELENK